MLERKQVLNEMTTFYKELYSEQVDNRQEELLNYLKDENIPKIENNIKEELDEPITVHELSKALKELKHNKTPGNDSLPPEFYKMFWKKLKDTFWAVVNEAVENKKLYLSARWGVIVLIEKQGKDVLLLKNWRPISLLNTDKDFV